MPLDQGAGQGEPGCGELGGDGRAAWAMTLGLEPSPGVLLHPSVIERFATHAPGLSGPAQAPD
jgi:hypothetical protein